MAVENDYISRQVAIDGFYEMASDMDYLCTVSDYVSFLESMSSAQPEIIRCKDCSRWCICHRSDDWYCADAERIKDGSDR